MTERSETGPDLAGTRTDYTGPQLLEGDAPDDQPWSLFGRWLGEAYAGHADGSIPEPTAMSVATAAVDPATGEPRPSVRVVLLKGHDERGITFFTNYDSRKGRELAATPWAGALLHWVPLHRQVRFTGPVTRVDPSESDAYFASRPRGSQVGARASAQSRELTGADEIARLVAAEDERWQGADVPRPEHWGGFRLDPVEVEFWQGRPSRLHDRLVYRRDHPGADWHRSRLAP